MAGTDRVGAHLLQQAQLARSGVRLKGRAEAAEIMVQADAAQIDVAVVEQQALVGRELDGAAAELCFQRIGRGGAESGFDAVEVGFAQVPQARGREGEFGFGLIDRLFLPGAPGARGQRLPDSRRNTAGGQIPFRPAERKVQRFRQGRARAQADLGRAADGPDISLPFPRGDVEAVRHEVRGRHAPQLHGAEQPRAGIPA